MIKIENLHKSFGDLHVLKGVNFQAEKGEVVVIEESFGVRVTEIIKSNK